LVGNELIEVDVGEHAAWALRAVADGDVFEVARRDVTIESLDRAIELCCSLRWRKQSARYAGAGPALAAFGGGFANLMAEQSGHVVAIPKAIDRDLEVGRLLGHLVGAACSTVSSSTPAFAGAGSPTNTVYSPVTGSTLMPRTLSPAAMAVRIMRVEEGLRRRGLGGKTGVWGIEQPVAVSER
jgi:hypothetical protein